MRSVLVVGSGAREHALAWKLAQSSQVSRVVVAPGNAGMPSAWERWEEDFSKGKIAFERLAQRAQAEKIDLTVVGPDHFLADGIVDVFQSYSLRIFGPTAKAAQIESSKIFAKEIMRAAEVPTARYSVLTSENEIESVISQFSNGWVVKADGLALGKGVEVCHTPLQAKEAVRRLLPYSGKVLIEERLSGEEISWMAFSDGSRCSLLEPARDYKRLLNGDRGPNTGGMGAYSPVLGFSRHAEEWVREKVFTPVLKEMSHRGIPFRGLLYAGLMFDKTKEQFWVLEFNARFGDPETQVLLPRFKDDFFLWCQAVADGDLSSFPNRVPFHEDSAVYVVVASQGYPEKPKLNQRVVVDSSAKDSVFFAGVKKQEQDLVSSGGRVLGALGMGLNLELARKNAYQMVRKIDFEAGTYRTDIADNGVGN